MNEINKEELFGSLKGFLKSKGIDVQDGSYADGIRKGCDILTDTVNLSQRAFERAKGAMEKGVDQVRQTVHERTAPKSASSGTAKKPAPAASKSRPAKAKPVAAKRGHKKNK